MSRFLYLHVIVIFLLGSNLQAQSTLVGNLIDKTDQSPLEYASVVLYRDTDSALVTGTVTNVDGYFELTGIPKGNFYLMASFMGYNSYELNNISSDGYSRIDLDKIALSGSSEMLEEITVRGRKSTAIHKIDRQVYGADQFENSRGGSATDVIRNIPSIALDAEGNISVRGTTGFVVMLNGKPIQTSPSVVLGQLPANAIKSVEIITAPSAKFDPEGKAGILNIIMEEGAADGMFTQVNIKYGLPPMEPYDNADRAQRYGGDVVFNYRKDQWNISAGASYQRNDLSGRRVGDVYTSIDDVMTRFPSDGERSFDEVNYSGRFTLGYNPDKSNSFQLGFFAGKRSKDRTADILYYNNEKSFVSSGEKISDFQYYNENLRIRRGDFVLGSLDYSHTFSDQSLLSVSGLYEYTLLGGPTTNRNLHWPSTEQIIQDEYNTNDNPLNGARLSIDYAMAPFSWGQFEWGYQFRNLDHTGDFVYERKNNQTGEFELVPEFSSEVDLKRSIHAAYGLFTGESGKWAYGLGLRIEAMDRSLRLEDKKGLIDTFYNYDFIKPFPSANIQYTVNDHVKVKAAYSKRVQRTTTFKMNPFPEREHSETLEQGDPNLRPEFIDIIEAGIVGFYGDHSSYANVYYRSTDNLINRVNNVYNDTILNRIYSNVGNGNAWGMEIGNEWNLSEKLNVFAGGNLYKYTIEGTFDNLPVNTSSWVHSVNINIGYDISDTWSLQANLNYLSDRNTAQGVDSEFYSPNLTLRKSFLDNRLVVTAQWQNIDMGLLSTNEQRITTWRTGAFYTTTNYIYEVDMISLNLSYSFNSRKNESKFIESEFGRNEF